MSAEEVARCLAELERSLIPAHIKEISVKLEQTMRLWRLPSAWEDVADFYIEALEGLPSDLLDLALKRVRLRHKYPEAPKPADFVDAVSDELAARTMVLARLKTAAMMARRDAEMARPAPILPPPLGSFRPIPYAGGRGAGGRRLGEFREGLIR